VLKTQSCCSRALSALLFRSSDGTIVKWTSFENLRVFGFCTCWTVKALVWHQHFPRVSWYPERHSEGSRQTKSFLLHYSVFQADAMNIFSGDPDLLCRDAVELHEWSDREADTQMPQLLYYKSR
jgi:hypothetical protein